MKNKTTPKKKKQKVEQVESHIETITDAVGEIATHYGFTVIKPPHIKNDDIAKAKQWKDHDHYNDTEEKIALTRWFMERGKEMDSLPAAVHYKKNLKGLNKKGSSEIYGFEILGSPRATSEALLLKCALSVLDELGYKDVYVDVNSIGDKESMGKFERELSVHFKKHHHALPVKWKEAFRKNHHSVLLKNHPDIKEFMVNAPQSIGSLSETARLHFKEVLESVEAFEAVYKIKSNIFSNKHFASYTVFEIRQNPDKKSTETEGELLAYGYRYNNLAKKIGGKKDLPTVGLTIIVKKNKITNKKIPVNKIKKPKFYLVQLGNFAKLKALNVLEMLRQHKIPVYHSITKDKIGGQLNGAEYMKASHVLIIGQKEAIENTVVVRDINNREQETVAVKNLSEFLKNIDKNKKDLKK
ncbi:MAG: His/Gly/Thr/Pro-type tRNA ligase C-terminal domain-containing protein [Patescibacteria group bacterium]